MDIFHFFVNRYEDFILIYARTTAILALVPIIGSTFVNILTKAFLGLAVAILFTGVLAPLDGKEAIQQNGFAIVVLHEVVIGAAIGIVANVLFEAVIFAGYITDYQIGFGFINIIDPMSGQSISIIAFFSNLLAMALFLILDFHHVIFEAIVESYQFLPIYGVHVTDATIANLTQLYAHIFFFGFKLAAPMVAVMFTVDFSMGILGKTVPQLQILMVGFPVKISIGLIAFGLALRAFSDHIIILLSQFRNQIFWFIRSIGVLS